MISAKELRKLVKTEKEIIDRGVNAALNSLDKSLRKAADSGAYGYSASIGRNIGKKVKDELELLGYKVILNLDLEGEQLPFEVYWEEMKDDE